MESISKVETYTIKNNWLTISTNPMPILDANNNIIGYVSKFFNSMGEKIVGYLSGRPIFYNFQTEDTDGNIRIRVIQSILFFKRAEWKVELYTDQQKDIRFLVRDSSIIGASKTLAFEFKGRQIIMENKNVHYQTRFIDNNNDVIAQCECKGIPKSFYIQVFKPELDIYQISTLALIQYYWSIIV